MSTTPSPLARVIGKILPDLQNVVFDYKSGDDFEELWNSAWNASFFPDSDDSSEGNEGGEFRIIVNSDLPFGTSPAFPILEKVNFASHFSSLSWAACHLVHLSRHQKAEAKTCGILIIDASYQRSQVGDRLKALFRSSPTDQRALVPNVIHLVNPNLETICQAIKSLKSSPLTISDIQGEILASLLGAAVTTERQDHHAIGNVLSAYLLANQTLNEKTTLIAPLMDLQEQCATLCSAINRHEIEPWRTGKKPMRVESLVGPVLLIDDMADIWRTFLDGSLPDSDVYHVSRSEFDSFIATLPGRVAAIEQGKKFTPRLLSGNDDHPADENFILFLDLRLLPDGIQRTTLYKALAKTGLELHKKNRLHPWLTSESDRREWRAEMEDIIVGKGSGQMETLPARLLSLLDPTLPIVIFSSTHASDLTEPFRPYGNIITLFRKPTPAHLSDLVMSELKQDFFATVGRALKIKQARRLLSRLKNTSAPRIPAAALPCCEIFLDESGKTADSAMNISGIGVCAGTQEAIGEFHRVLHDRVHSCKLSPGVSSFDAALGYRSATRPENGYIPKRAENDEPEAWAEHWNRIAQLADAAQIVAEENDVSLFAFSHEFSVSPNTPEWLDAGETLDKEQRDLLDIRYSVRMVELLESLVFDLFQANARDPEAPLNLGVDLASREALIPVGALNDVDRRDHQLCRTMLGQWGVACDSQTRHDSRANQNVDYLVAFRKSVDDRTPLRFMEIAMNRRHLVLEPKSQLKIFRARACLMLNWKEGNGHHHLSWEEHEMPPLPLHYLADYISNAIRNKTRDAADSFLENAHVKAWFASGLKITSNDEWRQTLLLWDQGERVKALKKLASLDDAKLLESPAYFRSNVSAWPISTLSADEFKSLFG